jgi:hypothetical protein
VDSLVDITRLEKDGKLELHDRSHQFTDIMQDLETGICQEIEIRYKHLHLEKDY